MGNLSRARAGTTKNLEKTSPEGGRHFGSLTASAQTQFNQESPIVQRADLVAFHAPFNETVLVGRGGNTCSD